MCCAESDNDVLLEVDLPFWIHPEDITVAILLDRLRIAVCNELDLTRVYWQNKCTPCRLLLLSSPACFAVVMVLQGMIALGNVRSP